MLTSSAQLECPAMADFEVHIDLNGRTQVRNSARSQKGVGDLALGRGFEH